MTDLATKTGEVMLGSVQPAGFELVMDFLSPSELPGRLLSVP
jgi:hypothetical protein